MASTIKIKNSSTASAVPTSSDLVQGELAVNVTDKRIFTENASGTVVELGTNPSTLAVAGTTTLSGNQVISVTDNTNAALRITQLGTGNALLVEDSSNPDSSPFVIDASGNVIRGYTAALTFPDYAGTQRSSTAIQNIGTSYAGATVVNTAYVAAAGGSNYLLAKSRSGTIGTNIVVSSGDILGTLSFAGDDGTNFINAAQISAAVDGTPGTNDMPGRLVFSTTADGASSPTERVRIASDGLVSLQNSSGLSIARTAVTSPASTDGNVFSGTYTPTLTNTTNISSSTANPCQYMRVGNVVTVSGAVAVTATAVSAITLGISLPIASALAASIQIGGTGAANNGLIVSIVSGDATNDRATMNATPTSTANWTYFFSFTYRII